VERKIQNVFFKDVHSVPKRALPNDISLVAEFYCVVRVFVMLTNIYHHAVHSVYERALHMHRYEKRRRGKARIEGRQPALHESKVGCFPLRRRHGGVQVLEFRRISERVCLLIRDNVHRFASKRFWI